MEVFGYKLPKGIVAEDGDTFDEQRGVMGLAELKKWKEDRAAGIEQVCVRRFREEAELEAWIHAKYTEGKAHAVAETWGTDALKTQCFLLGMFKTVTRKPLWMSYEEWVTSDLGLTSINDLYPVIPRKGLLNSLYKLINLK